MKLDQVYYMSTCFRSIHFELTSSVRSMEKNWVSFHSHAHCFKIIENHVPTKLSSTIGLISHVTTPLAFAVLDQRNTAGLHI